MTHTMTQTKRLVDFAVVRISDSSAMRELEKKVKETAAMHSQMDGAETLAKLGASPLDNPKSVDGRLYSGPGFRAVLFRIPGARTWVLMALGSATKVNLGDDDNAFVQLLKDVLQQLSVDSLWVADFARLLRSIDYLSDTWKAVSRGCRYVRHAGAVIDIHSPTAEIQFLFEALSAAAEARAVVKRTVTGKMRGYVDGRCPLGPSTLPAGYIKSKSKRLGLADASAQAVVRTIVQVLGEPGLTNQQRVERVAAAGGISAVSSKQQGRRVGVDRVGNASDTVARWYAHLDVWRTGRWIVRYHIPTLLTTTRFDLPIDLHEELGCRVWTMDFKLPLPVDGWATEDEFEAAAALRERRAERQTPAGGGAAGRARKPLSGFSSWTEGPMQYGLLSGNRATYDLLGRPVEESVRELLIDGRLQLVPKGWGRRGSTRQASWAIATLSAPALHRAVADGLIDAAEKGLVAHGASTGVLSDHASVGADLRARLAELRRFANNARRNSVEADTDSERRRFLRDHAAVAAEAQQLEADLLRLLGESGAIPVDIRQIAATLAAIADQHDHVPADIADACREVITDLRILPADSSSVRWEANLRIPLFGGTLTVGPAHGEIPIGPERHLAGLRTASLADRAGTATELLMAKAYTVTETAQALELRTHRRVGQTVRDHLKSRGLTPEAASYLVAHATPSARRVVWERLNGRPYPQDFDPVYAAHVASVYLDGHVSHDVQRDRILSNRKRLIDTVLAAGGWVAPGDLDGLCRDLGITRSHLGVVAKGRFRRNRWTLPVLREHNGGVGLIPCPHAGCTDWATLVVRHPEAPREVLCPSCLRMPSDEYAALVFPEDYRPGCAT